MLTAPQLPAIYCWKTYCHNHKSPPRVDDNDERGTWFVGPDTAAKMIWNFIVIINIVLQGMSII